MLFYAAALQTLNYDWDTLRIASKRCPSNRSYTFFPFTALSIMLISFLLSPYNS